MIATIVDLQVFFLKVIEGCITGGTITASGTDAVSS